MAPHERPPIDRYSDWPLPAYSYVPGATPHPVSDPRGHNYGSEPRPAARLDPRDWRTSPAYCYAVDLFNHGFYWEAHESWEQLWHAEGRRGATALWLKGLIKLAAAGVKLREGNAAGAARHAQRALQLLEEVTAAVDASRSLREPQAPRPARSYCGIDFTEVRAVAAEIVAAASAPITLDPQRRLKRRFTLH